MKLIVGSKIQLQQKILIFGANFQKKKNDTSRRKQKKMNIIIEFFILELV